MMIWSVCQEFDLPGLQIVGLLGLGLELEASLAYVWVQVNAAAL